jgi:hypothetical protein
MAIPTVPNGPDILDAKQVVVEKILVGLRKPYAERVRLSVFDANAGAIQDLSFAAVQLTEFALALHNENVALRKTLKRAIEDMNTEAKERIELELAKMRANMVGLAEELTAQQRRGNPPPAEDAEFQQSVIQSAREAWSRIRSGSTFNDWILIGRALLVGRCLCMHQVGASKPRGMKYVRAMGQWLTDNGFPEISSTARKCAASCAEKEEEVRAFLETLPEARRERLNHCAAVWYTFKGNERKWRAPDGCKNRKPIDQKRFQAAVEAVRAELAKLGGEVRDAPQIAAAAIRAAGFSVLAPYLRKVTVVKRIAETEYRISLPRVRALEDVAA